MKNFSSFLLSAAVAAAMFLHLLPSSTAFSPSINSLSSYKIATGAAIPASTTGTTTTQLFEKISDKRRKQLGIGEGEDEYDLGFALEQNTDPLISKIIAGSFILVMITLLVVGVVIPSLADYGEGVCNPIQTAGRC